MGYTLGLGNQIDRIDDAMSNSVGFNDNGNKQAGEYTYDTNGNMTEDLNKGITSITYNYMNLPEVITIKNPTGGNNKIVYTYDAAGTKLSQQTFPNGGGTGVTTDYSAGFVYEDDALSYFPFSEGTVRKVGTSFRLEYNLTDHLGNVRATFYPYQYNSPVLLQADSYYPFGLKMPGLSYVASGSDENKFTYNGKELEDEFGLDWYHYGARYYDPVVGRWWAVDPVDEHHSPYNYVANNPVMYTDPDGMKKNPVFSSITGRFLGTDSKGYEGEPIFMDDDQFTQGMDHNLAASIGTFMSSFDLSGLGSDFYWHYERMLLGKYRGEDPAMVAFQLNDPWGYHYQTNIKGQGAVQDVTFETVSLFTGIYGLGRMAITKFVGKSTTQGAYYVYQGIDDQGLVRYIGISGREIGIRFGKHTSSGTLRSLLDYSVLKSNMTKLEARILEQKLINKYVIGKKGGQLYNEINSIARKYWNQYGIK